MARGVRVDPRGPRSTGQVEAVGTVRSATQTVIASKVPGYVREVRAREGEVGGRRARLLVVVEDREFRGAGARAQAALYERRGPASMRPGGSTRRRCRAPLGRGRPRYAEATATRYRRLLDRGADRAHE